MGFIVNTNIENHVYVLNGAGSLIEKRAALLRQHGAVPKIVAGRLVTVDDLTTLGSADSDGVVDGLFVVPHSASASSLGGTATDADLAALAAACRRLRVPINVSERPALCTFTLPSLHTDGDFQLAVSTNGMGCRLANRIKRTAVSALPSEMGLLCANIGGLRAQTAPLSSEEDDDDAVQSVRLNALVTESRAGRQQRLRWLAQMVEYYPLDMLKSVTEADLAPTANDNAGAGNGAATASNGAGTTQASADSASGTTHVAAAGSGSVSLVGAGPGRASLLTAEALREINGAEYVLADKLVPEEVLQLVPRHVPVFIARKFPGNAERAQQELLEIGLAQLRAGRRVVRLKQGDPYVYGRGFEELAFFRQHGVEPRVVPGITSALAAPLLANIPPTHRGYADQILICTGTGRAGKLLDPPEFVRSRTVVFLMVLHRMREVAEVLIAAGWDRSLPVAAIERASCPDQRIIRSTLAEIADELERAGSRPPGMLVAGDVCALAN